MNSPTPSNIRPLNCLAAGGIPGLRKRLARNRAIALSAFVFLILLGALFVYLQYR